MLISSNNKNPLINFERKHRKHQKSQNPIGSKFSLKCMKNEIKLKKKGKNSLTSTRRQKSWRKFDGKRQKKLVLSLDRSKRERIELFENLNSEEHVKNLSFKNSLNDFWLIEKQVWSIENYLRLIQHQSSQANSNQILNRNFNRLSNRFDRSKIWKKQIFEKHSSLM